MKKTIRLAITAAAICGVLLVLSSPLLSREVQPEASMDAESEMKAALGTVPVMFRNYPDHLRAGAWAWFKSTMSPDAALSAKYSELISLGVASQIPCDYCVYAHTTMARMLGATDAEIREAVASAANTRHWSTVLNGADVPLEEFKKEWDGILAHLKEQSAAE